MEELVCNRTTWNYKPRRRLVLGLAFGSFPRSCVRIFRGECLWDSSAVQRKWKKGFQGHSLVGTAPVGWQPRNPCSVQRKSDLVWNLQGSQVKVKQRTLGNVLIPGGNKGGTFSAELWFLTSSVSNKVKFVDGKDVFDSERWEERLFYMSFMASLECKQRVPSIP